MELDNPPRPYRPGPGDGTLQRRGPGSVDVTRRATPLALGLVLLAAALAGCEKQSVRVAYRPEAGSSYRYEIKIQSVTTTRLGTGPSERTVDDVVLEARHKVVDSGPDAVRVRVELVRAGSPDRTFLVRFDRGGQLAGVEAVDGLPPEVLGPSGLPPFLPAAATAPPDRPLAPGDTWKIDVTQGGPGSDAVGLEGTGKLEKITSAGGRKAAEIKARTRLPLSSTSQVRGSRVSLEGTETTESTATRAVPDGALERASSITRGTYRLSLAGPSGTGGEPVVGTMTVEIRSDTRRLPDPGAGG